ncbi:MAG: YcfL family protein [Betaproteobacteria bacterium]
MKYFTNMRYIYSLVSVLVLLVGCASQIDKHSIRMGSTDDIKVIELNSVERNGLLTAQATIENRGNSKPVAYRFRWLSKDGLKIADDEAWKPITIGKGRQAVIEGIAPSQVVKDFKIEFNSY